MLESSLKMSELWTKTCVPCRGSVPRLRDEELAALENQVDGWKVVEECHITRTFGFPDFRDVLEFVNSVGENAEKQGHHPDIFPAWGKVKITIWTHKINGLSGGDIILAARIDRLATAIIDEKFKDFLKPLQTDKEVHPETGTK